MKGKSQIMFKNRYCGSKFPHEAHTQPMIGNELVVYNCRGRR